LEQLENHLSNLSSQLSQFISLASPVLNERVTEACMGCLQEFSEQLEVLDPTYPKLQQILELESQVSLFRLPNTIVWGQDIPGRKEEDFYFAYNEMKEIRSLAVLGLKAVDLEYKNIQNVDNLQAVLLSIIH
jgi:hypothetical protein